MANRHLSRTVAMQSLYEWDFNDRRDDLSEVTKENIERFASGASDTEFVFQLVQGVHDQLQAIDALISKHAPDWPIDKIAPVDRSILRVGVFELMFLKDVPSKVAINEAVEMGKVFSGENAGKFINGVLGALFKELPVVETEEAKEQKTA